MRDPETWCVVKDFESYLISNHGNVISIRMGKPRHLRPRKCSAGYLFVTLLNHQGQKHKTIHWLVFTHFVGDLKPDHEINHKDLNKLNNYFGNLNQLTHQQNIAHAFEIIMRKRRAKKLIVELLMKCG